MSTLEEPRATRPSTTHAPTEGWSPLRTAAAVMGSGGVLLLADVFINPGPGLTSVNDSLFVAGHLLNAVAYLMLALGLPAVAVSVGRSLGLLGALGYACLVIRYTLSTGSQLFQAGIYHTLAQQPGMRPHLAEGGDLASIYGQWDDAVSLILGIGMLALVPALWRADRSLRAPAGLFLAVALTEIVLTPASLLLVAILVIWLGLRIIRNGDVRRPLRARRRQS